MKYITDWKEIDRDKEYVVFPINGKEGAWCLGCPVGKGPGWRVISYREGCYAALEMPEFTEEDVPLCLRK